MVENSIQADTMITGRTTLDSMAETPFYNYEYFYEDETALNELNERYSEALLPFAVLMGVFCVFGILGNILIIIVFSVSREYRNTNFRLFVLSLGIIDLLSCITLMPAEILKTRHFFSFPSPAPCKAKCFFNIFAMNAAAYVLLVICIDRYRKVCQPLKRQIWPGMAGKILVLVILASLLLSIPAPIMCGIQKENVTTSDNVTITVQVCSAEEEYHDSAVRYAYKFGLSIALVIVALSFIIMYILIVRTIIIHRQNRSEGNSIRFESNKHKSLTYNKDTDNVYVRVHLVLCPNGCEVKANHFLKVPSMETCKLNLTGYDMKLKRHHSSSSLTSNSSKSRFKLWRSGSDVSFRSQSLRERSLSRVTFRFPYKTLIWLVLTLIFLITFLINAGLSFLTLKEHTFSPQKLMWFQIAFRLYFINHIVNPVVYAILDKRFKSSCKRLFSRVKKKIVNR